MDEVVVYESVSICVCIYVCVYTHTYTYIQCMMEYYSAIKKEGNPAIVTTWMTLKALC